MNSSNGIIRPSLGFRWPESFVQGKWHFRGQDRNRNINQK